MKLLKKSILFLFLWVISITIVKSLRKSSKLNTNGVKCSVSSISIPNGTNLPVVVFKASVDEEDIKLTVLEKEHRNNFKVKGNLVMDDKIKGESWYVDNKHEGNSFESMRDAFSLCKSMHEENKDMKLYEMNEDNRKNNNLIKFRTNNLPENVEEIKADKASEDKAKINITNNNKEAKDEIDQNISLLHIKSSAKSLSKTQSKENNPKEFLKEKNDKEKVFNFGSYIRLKELLTLNDIHF